MKHRILSLTAALLAFLFCCTASDYHRITDTFTALKGKPEVTVVIVGDAISDESVLGSGLSWGSYLKPKLSEFLGARVSLINSSRPDLTYDMAMRFHQEDVFAFRPDVVFVMLGMADPALQTGDLYAVRDRVTPYFETLAKRDALVIVLTLTGFRDMDPGSDNTKLLDKVNEEIIRNARLNHFPVIDVAKGMRDLQSSRPDRYRELFANSLFLSESGSEFVADVIIAAIRRAAEQVK